MRKRIRMVQETVRWLRTDRELGRSTVRNALFGIGISWIAGIAITELVTGGLSQNALLICLAVPLVVVPPHVWLYTRLLRNLDSVRGRFEEQSRLLAIEKECYRQLLGELPIGIVVHRNLKPLYANAAAARISGRDSVEAVLQANSIVDLVHPGDLSQFLALPPGQLSLDERFGPVRLRLRRPDGEHAVVELTACTIDWDGAPARQASLLDVTEQVRAATSRDDFITTVTHELRTPLTSIHGALGLAREPRAAESGHLPRLIAIAHDNSERLVRLLNDVLRLERFESGRFIIEFAPVACAPLLREAVHQNQGLAGKLGVGVRIVSAAPVPDILGNHDALLQVLGNLLSNATKFSPAGGFIEVTAETVGDKVRFCVSDQGPGIAPEFRPHVFTKFMQGPPMAGRAIGGSGLGLSICKAIVEQHGGEIGFDSKPGLRTDFYFTIPQRPGAEIDALPAGVTLH